MVADTDVGAHLKAIRQSRGLSQRELAKRAGVTNGMISLIEQNRVSPSVSSLRKVLEGVPMTLAEFFAVDVAAPPRIFYAAEELPASEAGGITTWLVAGERPGRSVTLARQSLGPGADSGLQRRAEPGDIAGVVLAGAVEVTVGAATRVLGPGDAYCFSAAAPHRFRNGGEADCEIITARAGGGP